jgi:hypothetical protein
LCSIPQGWNTQAERANRAASGDQHGWHAASSSPSAGDELDSPFFLMAFRRSEVHDPGCLDNKLTNSLARCAMAWASVAFRSAEVPMNSSYEPSRG